MSEKESTSNPIVRHKRSSGLHSCRADRSDGHPRPTGLPGASDLRSTLCPACSSLDEITTLPTALREELKAEGHAIGLPEIVQTARSIDGTERYLIRMADGETVETVWMPGGDGGERGDGTQAAEEEEHPIAR